MLKTYLMICIGLHIIYLFYPLYSLTTCMYRSQLCINTAIVYMHRFYAFHSFTQFHRNAMAAAALFLAAKVIIVKYESCLIPPFPYLQIDLISGRRATQETGARDKSCSHLPAPRRQSVVFGHPIETLLRSG